MFKSGDVVRLKSGSPLMTVEKNNYNQKENECRCQWFRDDEVRYAVFNSNMLELKTKSRKGK